MGEQSKQRIFRTNLSNAHTQHHPHPHKINRNAIKRQVATHWNEKKIDNIAEKKTPSGWSGKSQAQNFPKKAFNQHTEYLYPKDTDEYIYRRWISFPCI